MGNERAAFVYATSKHDVIHLYVSRHVCSEQLPLFTAVSFALFVSPPLTSADIAPVSNKNHCDLFSNAVFDLT